MGRLSVHAQATPRAYHAERWRHAHGCGRFFNALRDTTTDHFLATYRDGRAAARSRRTPVDERRELSHRARRPHRPRTAAAVLFDGKLVRRLRRRHAGLGAARQRRASGRPLVQISPAARHPGRRLRRAERAGDRDPRRGAPHAEPARDPGRAVRRPDGREPEPLALPRASTSAASTICFRAFFPAGFYYKTFMWPRARLEDALRAGHPPRRRPRPRPTRPIRTAIRSASPIATCWWSARAPRASPPRSPPPHRAPGHSVRRAGRVRRLPARRCRRRRIEAEAGARLAAARRCRR